MICGYLIASIVRVLMLWNRFTCEEPIKVWLLVHQSISLFFCLSYRVAHCIPAPSYLGVVGLLPVGGTSMQRVISFVILMLIVPIFLASDSYGLYWFIGYSSTDDTKCWPHDVLNQPEVIRLVLLVDCACGAVFAIFGVGLLCRGLRPLLRARVVANAAADPPARRPTISTCSGARLLVPLQTLLIHCPEAQCDKDCNVHCSICQDFCREGQQLRTVVVCGHQYHGPCLEMWLRNRPTCPNCNQDVTTPVV